MIRFFDVVFSLVALIVLFPFMLPIMLLLKLTGEHDIFYGQERIGKGGKKFKLWKFATMLRNSPNMQGGGYTSENDPRLLPMGKFLRKTKINELPQLLNILFGDMSIIGYRPTVPSGYKNWPEDAKEKLKETKPGLSGIGSVVFRNEEEMLQKVSDKDRYYKEHILPYKMKLESWYIDHRTVLLYWRLIFLTVDSVLGGSRWKKIKGLPPVPDDLKEVL